MTPLNYNHLYYFYTVASEGSLSRASEKLHLTPQTLSGQISKFEATLGAKLFVRGGKTLLLSENGQAIFQQAEEVFQIGDEIKQVLQQQKPNNWRKFTVGITDVVPKALALRLLRSVFEMPEKTRLICHEGDQESLLADLAIHKLDCILSDQPLPANSPIKAYNHPVAQSGLTFFAHKSKAKKLAKNFPASLNNEPFLMQGRHSSIKNLIMYWFQHNQVTPNIVAEFDDSALLKSFASENHGAFAAPTIIKQEILEQYDVLAIGEIKEAIERYYIISPERKIKHPSTQQILNSLDKS